MSNAPYVREPAPPAGETLSAMLRTGSGNAERARRRHQFTIDLYSIQYVHSYFFAARNYTDPCRQFIVNGKESADPQLHTRAYCTCSHSQFALCPREYRTYRRPFSSATSKFALFGIMNKTL